MSANLGKFRVITTQRIIHGRFCADFQGEKTGQMGLNFARRRAKMARRNFGGQGHQGRQLREQDVRLMSKSSAALEEKGGGGQVTNRHTSTSSGRIVPGVVPR